jgi:hypothetical protein
MQDVIRWKLAFILQAANITAEYIDTKAFVILDQGVIGEIQLYTRVSVDGLDKDSFEKYVQEAKENLSDIQVIKWKDNLGCRDGSVKFYGSIYRVD